jgi:hypothetical protein
MAKRKIKHYDGEDDSFVQGNQSSSYDSDLVDPTDPASGPINPTRKSASPSASSYEAPSPSEAPSPPEDESDRGSMTKEQQENSSKTNAPFKKAKIVTKEQLEKSGLSLRDYMNKQQGLVRKSNPAAKSVTQTTTTVSNPTTPATKVSMADLEKKHANIRSELEKSDKPLEEVHPEQYFFNPTGAMIKAGIGLARSLGRGAVEKAGTEIAKRGAETGIKEVAKRAAAKEYYPHELTPQLRYTEKEVKRLTGPTSKNAKGGSINKASTSKRGDGIARKGHTKGRVC